MTEAPLVCVCVLVCDCVYMSVCVCVSGNFGTLDLAAVAHRRASVPRQHQGAMGVFNMQMIADQ